MTNIPISANISSEALNKLLSVRDNLKPLINVARRPVGDKFVVIVPQIENNDSYWTNMLGRICNIELRRRCYCTAKLTSVVFKTIYNLTEDDAIAAGYRGDDPLGKLKDNLHNWLSKKPYWNGYHTKIQLLNLEMERIY